MTVELSGALDGSRRVFTFPPGGMHSERVERANRVSVFDAQGSKLFEREDFRAEDWSGKYPSIYVLLTTTNAYVVPPDCKKTWRKHIGEIIQTN